MPPRQHKHDSSLGPVSIPDDDTVDEQTTDATADSIAETVGKDTTATADLLITDHSVLFRQMTRPLPDSCAHRQRDR